MDGSIVSEHVTSNSLRQLEISGHDCDSLGVNCNQICIFKQGNHVCFSSFLKSKDSLTLETDFISEMGGNFLHQALEWQFSDEQLSCLLVFSDLSESDCPWFKSMRFFDSQRNGCSLPGNLGGY